MLSWSEMTESLPSLSTVILLAVYAYVRALGRYSFLTNIEHKVPVKVSPAPVVFLTFVLLLTWYLAILQSRWMVL